MIPNRVLDRIRDGAGVYYVKGAINECWPWLKSVGSHGYPQIGWWQDDHSVMVLAHRTMWISRHGKDVPAGYEVDHRCFNVMCVNPTHLRLLTIAKNHALHRKVA